MMEDKQKKNTRMLIIGAIVMIFLFLVVRIITSQVNGTTGLSKYNGPVYDSVVLPNYDTKVKQYELDQIKEQEEKYRKSDDAVFMDFKSAYTKVVPVEDKPISNGLDHSPIKQANSETQFSQPEHTRYSPVTYNKENTINYNHASEEKSQQANKANTEPTVVIEKEDPFGTLHAQARQVKKKDMVRAEIYGDQKIINGGGVIVRNTEEILLEGVKIPENSILYGIASYMGDRVNINLTRAKTRTGDLTINIPLFDNDYIQGIYFKAPQDEAVDKTKEDINDDLAQQIENSRLVIKGVNIAKNAVKNAADAAKKNRKLTVNDGYIVYLNLK